MTNINIAYEVSAEAVSRVQALLDEVALKDPNWNGVEFVIVRDDFTSIGDAHDAYAASGLLSQVYAAIDGREDV